MGQARCLAQCWERCVGCQRQQVCGTVWCRWECARNRPLMSLRSPASLGAGPPHSIHLLMDDSDKETCTAYECYTNTYTRGCFEYAGGHCKDTFDHDICTYTHRDGQSTFQRWSACPYLVSVVMATPGLIPYSRTHWATASLPSSLSWFSFPPVCLLLFLSIPSCFLTIALSYILGIYRLLNPALRVFVAFFRPFSHPAICSILSFCPS